MAVNGTKNAFSQNAVFHLFTIPNKVPPAIYCQTIKKIIYCGKLLAYSVLNGKKKCVQTVTAKIKFSEKRKLEKQCNKLESHIEQTNGRPVGTPPTWGINWHAWA